VAGISHRFIVTWVAGLPFYPDESCLSASKTASIQHGPAISRKKGNMEQYPPMYFETLEIENIKCFGQKQVLDLRDQNGVISPWTLILGDNGVGKTTLLKCLAWMVPVVDPLTDEELNEIEEWKKNEQAKGRPLAEIEEQLKAEETIRIKPFLDELEDETEFEKLMRVGPDAISEIKASFTVGIMLGEVPDDESVVSLGVHFEREKGKLEHIELDKDKLKKFNSPNLFAYGANRHMGQKNVADEILKDPIQNLFSDFGDLYDAAEVLAQLEYASFKPETAVRGAALFQKIKQILADLLPDVESPDAFIIKSPLEESGLRKSRVDVITPYGQVSLSELSLGYKTMLAWTLDLALHMFWRNQDTDRPLEQPAVVIMDEIDLHLHPKWQRDVREYLLKHFPNTQFICTAHSPFMAQSSAGDNLAVLHRQEDEVYIQNDPLVIKEWRIGQIATSELFNIGSERGPEIEKKVNRRRVLLDRNEKIPEEILELKTLDSELADLPVETDPATQNLLTELQRLTENFKGGGDQK
jgi:predicted ATP-binding protein involved in virulence